MIRGGSRLQSWTEADHFDVGSESGYGRKHSMSISTPPPVYDRRLLSMPMISYLINIHSLIFFLPNSNQNIATYTENMKRRGSRRQSWTDAEQVDVRSESGYGRQRIMSTSTPPPVSCQIISIPVHW